MLHNFSQAREGRREGRISNNGDDRRLSCAGGGGEGGGEPKPEFQIFESGVFF